MCGCMLCMHTCISGVFTVDFANLTNCIEYIQMFMVCAVEWGNLDVGRFCTESFHLQ